MSARRFAAPAALLLAASGLAVLIHARHKSAPPAPKPATVTHAQPAFYRVHAGDSLATIAAKTGVAEPRLLKLNPNLNPTSLFIGAKIRLR